MSVLGCDRAGCDNIMCDYHAPIFGYICTDCKGELIRLLDGDETTNIYLFMSTHKNPDTIQGNGANLFHEAFDRVR